MRSNTSCIVQAHIVLLSLLVSHPSWSGSPPASKRLPAKSAGASKASSSQGLSPAEHAQADLAKSRLPGTVVKTADGLVVPPEQKGYAEVVFKGLGEKDRKSLKDATDNLLETLTSNYSKNSGTDERTRLLSWFKLRTTEVLNSFSMRALNRLSRPDV